MRIKRFTAAKLPEVIERIKEEFGLAAVILSQREDPDTGRVEVTAGVREEDLPPGTGTIAPKTPQPLGSSAPMANPLESGLPPSGPQVASPPAPTAKPPVKAGSSSGLGLKAYQKALTEGQKSVSPGKTKVKDEDLARELKETIMGGVNEIKELILDLAHRQSLAEKWRDRGDLLSLYRHLLATDLEPELARDLVEKAAESQAAWGGDLLEQLRRTVQPLIKCREMTLPRILAILGPSGSGKTTILLKLAALAQKRGLKTAAITLDTLKLGAAGQLAQYARIMGLGLRACQSRAEFNEAREIFEETDLILVDTSTRDLKGAKKLDLLEGSGAMTLLALPANLKTGDLLEASQKAAGPDLWGVALSKLDETKTLGGLVSLIIRAGPSLAFFSTGPGVAEDFGPAKADKFLDLWLGPTIEEGLGK
ncbi:MAG: hypothetical protein LBS60_06705 [Deltaproteobacteria bacterium]|jgi:flagellar biosynthesis protein FlhF|nr:hypothetical protein [Deltaproteobacteria bacterium]